MRVCEQSTSHWGLVDDREVGISVAERIEEEQGSGSLSNVNLIVNIVDLYHTIISLVTDMIG